MTDQRQNLDNLQIKKNWIIHNIRLSEGIGRLELARLSRISNSRVCELIKELIDEGLVLEEAVSERGRGRPPVPLRLNPPHATFVGVDIEAKRMRMVAVDFSGEVVWRGQQRMRQPKDRQGFIDGILEFIDGGLKAVREKFPNVMGLGMASPGVMDRERGMLLHYDMIEHARDIPLRDLTAEATGLPVAFEDNIRCYTLAEMTTGAGKGLDDFVCVAVRSGVGSGVVADGKIIEGHHGFAGEVGYMPVAVSEDFSEFLPFQRIVSEQALGVDVENGNGLDEEVARRAGRLLGAQLAAVTTVLDPEAIVLAGGLVHPDTPLWTEMEESFRRHAVPEVAEKTALLESQVGPFAAAVGAAHYCFRMLYPVETYPG